MMAVDLDDHDDDDDDSCPQPLTNSDLPYVGLRIVKRNTGKV